jgi:hypothetical protein
MRWLLLILVFDISNGGIRLVDQETKVFRSEALCEAEGQRLSQSIEYPGDNLRSMSICIPEDAYDDAR